MSHSSFIISLHFFLLLIISIKSLSQIQNLFKHLFAFIKIWRVSTVHLIIFLVSPIASPSRRIFHSCCPSPYSISLYLSFWILSFGEWWVLLNLFLLAKHSVINCPFSSFLSFHFFFFFVSIASCNNLLNDHLWWVLSFKVLWFAFWPICNACVLFHFIYICFELFLPISWASLVNCVVIDWFRFCGCVFFQEKLTKNYMWLSYKKGNGLSISVLHLY